MCAALAISGITTAMQAVGIGRVGAGYVMLMGSSSAFLAICVSALEQGGPGLLATLIIVSSLFQFVLAARLSALRRIFTPTVAGTVVMLIPVSLAAAHRGQARRRAGGRLARGGAGNRERDAARHRGDRASRLRCVAPVGTGHRHGGRQRDRRARLRDLRHGERARGGLDWIAGDGLARSGISVSGRRSGPCCRRSCW